MELDESAADTAGQDLPKNEPPEEISRMFSQPCFQKIAPKSYELPRPAAIQLKEKPKSAPGKMDSLWALAESKKIATEKEKEAKKKERLARIEKLKICFEVPFCATAVVTAQADLSVSETAMKKQIRHLKAPLTR